MKTHSKIQRWGNGLALRVAGIIRDIPHFKEGTEVEVDVCENGFTVTKSALRQKSIFPYNESELLEGLTHNSAHADLLALPLASEVEKE